MRVDTAEVIHTMFKTIKALVLREVKYREADKILTVLTENEGKMTLSARGVLRANSKLAAACQFLSYSDMTLYENSGKWYVKEAQTTEQFLGLRENIAALALGAYFAELLETVSDEDSPNGQILSLGLNSLFALSRSLYPPEHIKAVFEMKLMCCAGYEPQLDYCPVCGLKPRSPVFSTAGGTVLCAACRSAEYGECFPLDEGCLSALRHIIGSDTKRVFNFALEEGAAKKLAIAAQSYVTAQLERRFASLDYWRSVK